MPKVSKRGGFSDRNAIKPENTEIQLNDFDERTRVQLQNMVSRLYAVVFENDLYWGREHIQAFLKYILREVYSEPVDSRITYDDDTVFKIIYNTIHNDDYDDVLTLIEATAQYWDLYLKKKRGYEYYNEYDNKYKNGSIYEAINECFKKEYVGYRFIDSIIVPISDSYEIETINGALGNTYTPVYEHFSKANKLLADRN